QYLPFKNSIFFCLQKFWVSYDSNPNVKNPADTPQTSDLRYYRTGNNRLLGCHRQEMEVGLVIGQSPSKIRDREGHDRTDHARAFAFAGIVVEEKSHFPISDKMKEIRFN
uniref:Uncharacterized protein n=1 Tax=Romanomermis culicivorax TaxID=13658 RepID=A0A915JI95_ROMCU